MFTGMRQRINSNCGNLVVYDDAASPPVTAQGTGSCLAFDGAGENILANGSKYQVGTPGVWLLPAGSNWTASLHYDAGFMYSDSGLRSSGPLFPKAHLLRTYVSATQLTATVPAAESRLRR